MKSCIIYKDIQGNGWWEKGNTKFYPFGHFVFTAINTCAAVSQGKEKFITNEYYYLTYLNNPDYNLLMGYTDEKGIVSRDRMGEYYDNFIAKDKRIEIWQPEFTLLCNYIKNIEKFRNGENATGDLLAIYHNFKYFNTMVCSDIYDYMPMGKERTKYFDDIYEKLVIFKGMGFLEDISGKLFPVEEYIFNEMSDIFILDFWEFLFNPIYQKAKIRLCHNCNSIFANSNNNARYCEVCKQPEVMEKIRYANRKANRARKLHHDIVTLTYSLNSKGNDVSNSFLTESNYYWDICRGKQPEKVEKYSAKIENEADYMKWLEKKYEELKKLKIEESSSYQ